ncbi:hypothetical protein TSUD_109320 [Trifolium subterraneum]|nr:hypothetical protein TSUD_109320 [Trifolium subterraneum]
MKFRTAYVAPSSNVFGRGELVLTYSKIAVSYFSKDFWLDFIATLRLPQIYEKVAATFKPEDEVVIVNLDADKYRDLVEK